MLYGCKERTKHRVANQTRRQVNIFNNYINKQATKGTKNCVVEYKNVCEIEKKMCIVALTGKS